MSDQPSGEEPMRLGRYRIVRHIASGGMGAVYLAMDEQRNRPVALKVLNADLAAKADVRGRFKREATLGRRLRHRNIVELYEYDEHDGKCYLVMEYVKGVTLDDYLRKHGKMEAAAAKKLVKHVAKALDHAHQFGVVHRDVKPGNILLTNRNGRTIAKLADLGLSRETRDEEFRVTRQGHTVGTVDYLSPEQARDSHSADVRSDIYSLGCTLFDMLTGAPPFAEGTLSERLFAHAGTPAPDVRTKNKKVPENLALVCKRMLEKKPEDRYQTPTELIEALKDDAVHEPAPPASDAALPTEQSDSGHDIPTLEGTPKIPRVKLPNAPSPATPEEKQEAAGKFELAKKLMLAKDLPNALKTLLACCPLDPTRIEYRRYLRKKFGPKPGEQPPEGSSWLRTVYQKGLLTAAKLAKNHLQILALGEQALLNDPKDYSIHVQMAEAAQTLGFNKLALWLLKQLQKLDPKSVATNRALAIYFEKMGHYKPAIRFWEMVDKVDPKHPEAREHLKDLAARETLSRGHFRSRMAELDTD